MSPDLLAQVAKWGYFGRVLVKFAQNPHNVAPDTVPIGFGEVQKFKIDFWQSMTYGRS